MRGAQEELRDRGERQRDVLTFAVGGEVYALGIEHIREIIKNRPITEVPRVPSFVAGIIAVRGVVMPVIDLRLRLRLPAPALSRQARILVVTQPSESGGGDVGHEPFGLLVDQVHHVVRLQETDIEPPTMLSGHEADFVSGIGRIPGDVEDPRAPRARAREMLILLDLFRVLSFEHAGLHVSAGIDRTSGMEPLVGKGHEHGSPSRPSGAGRDKGANPLRERVL